MTYSRPGIRQTNANPGAPSTDPVRIRNRPTVQFGRGASYSDRFVDSGLAGRNAGQDAAAIGKFLQDIQDPLVKIGEQLDIENANRQVGEMLAQTPNLDQLYREGDEDVRNKLRSLSPRANDLMMERLTITAVSKFTEGYGAASQASSILTDPASTAEQRRDEKQRIKSEWMDKSGLNALPAGYLGAYAPQLAKAEGVVAGSLDKLRVKADSRRKNAVRAEELGVLVSGFAGQLEGLRTDPDSPEKVEQTKSVIAGLNAQLQQQLDQTRASGDGTPTEFLRTTLQGVQQQIAIALGTGDTDKAQAILDAFQTATKNPISIGDGKTNLWSLNVPGANGKSSSPQNFILQQQDLIDKWDKKANREEAITAVKPLFSLLTSGDPNQVRQAENQIPAVLGTLDPEGAIAALGLVTPLLNFVQQPTEQQLENFVVTVTDPGFQGLSRQEQLRILQGELTAGRISIKQFYNFGTRNADEEKRVYNEVRNASLAAVQEGTTLEPLNRLLGVEQAYAKSQGNGFGSDEAKAVQDLAIAKARERTAQQIRDARAAGESMTPEEIRKAYDTNLINVVNEREEELRGSINSSFNAASATTNQQVNNYLALVAQGKKGDARIPASLTTEMEKLGLTVNERTALDFLYNKMVSVKGQDGKPVYGADRNAARLWMQRNYDAARQRSRFAPSASPAPASNQSNQNSKSKPQKQAQANPVFEFATQTFEKVAGVLLPGGSSPASAATVMENEGQMETLAQLWERREPPTMTVPPLPQVASATAVQPVTMAIRTPNHPFFVAIGIAEGTRTANGGYTQNYYGHRDPGDGNWNGGTVSGGRNGGSPEQVDRKWMGSLTRTQMQYAPLLARFGIKSGTQGYNRLMFNVLDLSVQSPLALRSFVTKIPDVVRGNLTVESIAKARADSFFKPGTNRLQTSFPNYSALYADQRSRAGVWDYRRRL